MTKPKVFIVGSGYGIDSMFTLHGWDRTYSILDANLVQFTGGEDVTPALYGQGVHRKTFFNTARDLREQMVFNLALQYETPMAGICRGGQFLNVMCGGEMWQDVDNHQLSGTHEVIDEFTGEVFYATSTHHQMMLPGKDAILVASASESRFKEKVKPNGSITFVHIKERQAMEDPEVVFYPKQNCLCFQPHPEYGGQEKLSDIYFHYIKKYCFENVKAKNE